MVNTVFSSQYSVIRWGFSIQGSKCLLFLSAVFLNSGSWSLNTAIAKDLGSQGKIAVIEEEDPIALIQSKLKAMEANGELEQHYKELQKKTRASIERPKPAQGLTKAQKTRVFYYDPTYEVKEDIKDHLGRNITKKGTRINPLKTLSLSQNLIFFDGDDEEQKAWAQARIQKSGDSSQNDKKAKFILIKGAPLALSEELGMPVYFDQGGFLTQKLGIRYVPAVVSQDGLTLRIEEVELNGARE